MKKLFIFVFLFLSLFFIGDAAVEDPSLLTVERIFSSEEFTVRTFGPARWLKHKRGYTTLEPSKNKTGGRDILRYEPKTGRRFIEVPAAHLIPKGESKPIEIEDYQWSKNGKWLLVFTNTKRVWRRNTRGDYWVLNMKNRQFWKLGGEAEPSTLMFASFSPDGTRVGYVCKNNLFVQRLGDKPGERQILQLTADGSKTIINGTSDWVYEEEFGLREGFRWSPDGKYIAYWQFDAEGVGNFAMINNTGSLYPEIIPVQYPKVGTTNSACRLGVIASSGGKTRWFDLPGDSRNHYIPRMDWAGNSEEIVFQRLNRLQNTDKVMLGNIHSGTVRTLLTEQDNTWLDVVDDFKWLDKGKRFTWVSERDGWRHVYLVDRSGKNMQLITPGAFDVIEIVEIDDKKGWLYYIASPHNPTQRYLFRTKLDGRSEPQRLTPANLPGTHKYQLSPDMKFAFHTFSSIDTPPQTQLVRLPGHRKVRSLEANKELHAKVRALKRYPVEFFRVDIGEGVLLDAWCMKPPGFDPAKNTRYPLFFYVYGEPAGQTVLDRWGKTNYLWHLMLTQQGYLVMSIDNRGTPGPRGREWRKCIYRQIGIQASADQAAAARTIIKNRPYVDPKRIGIWGWSGGGSMTLNLMFRSPELYHTGISIAPVANQRFYNTIYQERYMGLPKDNPEGYEKGSPITFAHQLKGNLLLIHGTGDDNVHYQNTETLIDALVKADKYFSLMVYPNRSHSIKEGENTRRHLFELMTRFLNENLPPAARGAFLKNRPPGPPKKLLIK